VNGIMEGAEPDASHPVGGSPQGVLDQCVNLISNQVGRLVVRGGSRAALTLVDDAGTPANVTSVLGVWNYSQTGALAIAHSTATSKHYAYRLTPDLAYTTGAVGTSRHSLGTAWATATPGRPVVSELWEKLYVADGTLDYAGRRGLVSIDSAGTVTAQTYDLDGSGSGLATIKAYTCAAYNGVLFTAGYDTEASGDEPAMLRHSLLGTAPDASGGFDKDAWNIIGARGQAITAMVPGRSILLVAKANELYRLSGYGRALPGWQYTVEQVDNTLGFGCSNPYALCHAEGFWYGVGESGPFRTDGADVQSLVGPRRRSWRQVTNLRTAWVAFHPERRVVKFAFNQTPVDTGRSSTFPFVIWNYDIDRGVWTGDEKYSADLAYAQPIYSLTASSTVSGSSGNAPTSLPTTLRWIDSTFGGNIESELTVSVDLEDGTDEIEQDEQGESTSSIHLQWVNGDSTAITEVWARTDTSGSTLILSVAAGATDAWVNLRLPATRYWVKVRHRKNGQYSAFTSEINGYTKALTPALAAEAISPTEVGLTVRGVAAIGNVTYYRRVTGSTTSTAVAVSSPPAGTITIIDGGLEPATSYEYTAVVTTAWPSPADVSDTSAGVTVTTLASRAPTGVPTSPIVIHNVAETDSVTVQWSNGDAHASTQVWARTASGSSSLRATVNAGATSAEITSLTNGTLYYVKLRHVIGASSVGAFTTEVAAYTALSAPTITNSGVTTSSTAGISLTQVADGSDLILSRSGETIKTYSAQAAGTVIYSDTGLTADTRYDYTAVSYRSTWPTALQTSPVSSPTLTQTTQP
jgi:hypothetical protein